MSKSAKTTRVTTVWKHCRSLFRARRGRRLQIYHFVVKNRQKEYMKMPKSWEDDSGSSPPPQTLQGRALDARLMRICGQGLQQKHSQHIFSSFSLWYNIAHCRPALFLNDMFFFKLMVNMLLFCFVLFTLLFFLCLLYFRYRDRGKIRLNVNASVLLLHKVEWKNLAFLKCEEFSLFIHNSCYLSSER